MKWTPRRLKLLLNVYPPYLGAGVRVTHVASDWRELRVEMRLRWFNRNAVGVHFGGSLYSMVDPHLMLLLMQVLGKEYVVWDQAARIVFRRPGEGRVRAVLRITDELLERIRRETASGAPYRPELEVEVLDDADRVVASVTKTLYVRRRSESP